MRDISEGACERPVSPSCAKDHSIKIMVLRVFLTFIVFSVWGFVAGLFRSVSAVVSGAAAVTQFQDSASGYIAAQTTMGIFSGGLPAWAMLMLLVGPLVLIWAKPLARAWKAVAGAFALATLLVGAQSGDAWALFDEGNPEYVEIMPNQTAFLIPLEGASKASQDRFMSEEFLAEKKVPTKRVAIPYQRYSTKDGTQYLPSAKLILVDRSPITREWVAASNRGTSNNDQAIRGETAESIDLHTGLIISAFVREEDAAKFLYWYAAGIKNRNNSASISDARSLAEVVDSNIRGMVQAVFAREIGKRTALEAVKSKSEIIDVVQKEVKAAFLQQGITITNLGYAEGFTFGNPEIQKAIDRLFIAKMDAETAKEMKDALPVLKARAEIDIALKNAEATITMAQRYAGGVPQTIMIPSDKTSLLQMMPIPGVSMPTTPSAPPAPSIGTSAK